MKYCKDSFRKAPSLGLWCFHSYNVPIIFLFVAPAGHHFSSQLVWGQSGCFPQSHLDRAKVTSVENFYDCQNWNDFLGFSLAWVLIKPLQLGLSRTETYTDKHLSSACAVRGKDLAGSSRLRILQLNLLKYLEKHEDEGNPSCKSQTSRIPICCSHNHSQWKKRKHRKTSYPRKHRKGNSLELTTCTPVC